MMNHQQDASLLAQLTFVGLSGGLALPAALAATMQYLDREQASQVRGLLRASRRSGLSNELIKVGRDVRFFAVLARAHITGAPLTGAVATFLDQERERRRAAADEQARRLPVKLLVPLTLLILPAFALLTVGPALYASLQTLLGPYTSLP